MKLAEALSLRAELKSKINALDLRIREREDTRGRRAGRGCR